MTVRSEGPAETTLPHPANDRPSQSVATGGPASPDAARTLTTLLLETFRAKSLVDLTVQFGKLSTRSLLEVRRKALAQPRPQPTALQARVSALVEPLPPWALCFDDHCRTVQHCSHVASETLAEAPEPEGPVAAGPEVLPS